MPKIVLDFTHIHLLNYSGLNLNYIGFNVKDHHKTQLNVVNIEQLKSNSLNEYISEQNSNRPGFFLPPQSGKKSMKDRNCRKQDLLNNLVLLHASIKIETKFHKQFRFFLAFFIVDVFDPIIRVMIRNVHKRLLISLKAC